MLTYPRVGCYVLSLIKKIRCKKHVLFFLFFAKVRQGRLRGSIDVALKTSTKDDVSKAAFLAEASKMKFLTHPNLLKMHGVVTSDGGPTMIVLEFMGGGDLQEYLRSPRGKAYV